MNNTTHPFILELQKKQKLSKEITPLWKVNDEVRVLKNMDINVGAVKDFLGKLCTVKRVDVRYGIMSDPRVEYIVQLGNREEPFWEDELDKRIKSKTK